VSASLSLTLVLAECCMAETHKADYTSCFVYAKRREVGPKASSNGGLHVAHCTD